VRQRVLVVLTALAVVAIAIPSVLQAEASSPAMSQSGAGAATANPGGLTWCIQTDLNRGCLPVPCVTKFCPESALVRAGAGVSTTAPAFVCAPGFELVCQVVGLVFCRKPLGCPTAGAAPETAAYRTTAAPAIDCNIPALCTVIGLVCREHCTITAPGVRDRRM
jgi:hypothetical protein